MHDFFVVRYVLVLGNSHLLQQVRINFTQKLVSFFSVETLQSNLFQIFVLNDTNYSFLQTILHYVEFPLSVELVQELFFALIALFLLLSG